MIYSLLSATEKEQRKKIYILHIEESWCLCKAVFSPPFSSDVYILSLLFYMVADLFAQEEYFQIINYKIFNMMTK